MSFIIALYANTLYFDHFHPLSSPTPGDHLSHLLITLPYVCVPVSLTRVTHMSKGEGLCTSMWAFYPWKTCSPFSGNHCPRSQKDV